MGKPSLLTRIRIFISVVAFNIFLWAIRMTQNEYLKYILDHEEPDPEIAAMTEEERRKAVEGAFGLWEHRDDMLDDWIESMRQTWIDRLDELDKE